MPHAAFLAGAALTVAGPVPVAPPPRPADPVPGLVRDLGSPEFAARERATARLAALDVRDPPPALLAAAASPDPEVRRRAGAAVWAIRDREAARSLAPAIRFAAAGAVDRFVANSASWTGPADDPRLWQPAIDLVKALNKRIKLDSGELHCWADVARYGRQAHSRFVKLDRSYQPPEPDTGHGISYQGVVAAGAGSPTGITGSTLVARGPVAARRTIQTSVVLANGDVRTPRCSNAMVVADGDIDIGEHVSGCLIIARGEIRVDGSATRCVLVAGGKVTVANQPPDLGEGLAPMVSEHDPNPLGFVTWFELSHAGVEAAKADGGVAVTKAAAGWPFAQAGVAKGDLVTKVGGQPVATPEELRRRLRDAHATAAEAAVHLRRDGKDLTVRVPLPN